MQSSIAEKVARLADALQQRGWTVTAAESCTGGAVAMNLTELAGSSAWFNGSFVTYSNELKEKMLGVAPETLLTYGAVSEQVVDEMCEGARVKAGADLAIAISGIAGPGGGSTEKPVGTVCFGVAVEGEPAVTETRLFKGDRHQVREQAVDYALAMLLDKLN
ncbi:nicotinamide-nucleotide amidohydrolase family protein [Pontibacterium granulatum]|uniref:CinA family protein n=1 Tax=Pontibacterium granulatum TaxID=2036029 RepID=UPI00249CCA08|nr:nicotinamide-nucleotide amidohydrolase family protein [Pontibacterium granulatum]MDI3322938.1 nicotinamide-nucleotide amidohydrolase family protein [Pontibacterium granulatum]